MKKLTPADFEKAAFLSRLLSERMLARLDIVTLQPKRILDVGCGVGYNATLLKQRFPSAEYVAVDDTFALLHYAKHKNTICATADCLPFSPHSFDLIFANLLLPWCADLQKIFLEWRQLMRPHGLLMFTSLGPDTLKEIPQSQKLPHLIDMHDVGDVLTKVGWLDPVLDVENITVTYHSKEQLLHELSVTDMIAHGVTLPQLKKNDDNVYAISYEIIHGQAWGASAPQGFAADSEGVVKIPLSQLRARR